MLDRNIFIHCIMKHRDLAEGVLSFSQSARWGFSIFLQSCHVISNPFLNLNMVAYKLNINLHG